MADFDRDSMLEMFTYEMSRLLEDLEKNVIAGESGFSMDEINEIFRIMHTIKGSAAMMLFDSISTVAHSMEDLFYYLREENPTGIDYGTLTDHVLDGMDFIKVELAKVEDGEKPDGDGSGIIRNMKGFLKALKSGTGGFEKPASPVPAAKEAKASAPAQVASDDKNALPYLVSSAEYGKAYRGTIWFENGCEMENIRAYTFIFNLKDKVTNVSHIPEDVIDENSVEYIRKHGFSFQFNSKLSYAELDEIVSSTIFLKQMDFDYLDYEDSSKSDDSFRLNKFTAKITFDEGSEMENIRAYNLVRKIEDQVLVHSHVPADLLDENSAAEIQKNGFVMTLSSDMSYWDLSKLLNETIFLKSLDLIEAGGDDAMNFDQVVEERDEVIQQEETAVVSQAEPKNTTAQLSGGAESAKKPATQHVISVNVSKLDLLLNLMGELVIAEAMVTQNPELDGLELESFVKEARQLHKIINDIQDAVMGMRLIPLQSTFAKMQRIVRDMCRQLNKEVELVVIGEDTEVDKNIIEHISDPLMHVIRNAVDHGIEAPEVRKAAGKPEKGKVILEAKNTGGDVLIIIRDDGQGLNRDKILNKAKNNGLLRRDASEYSDKEIHQFIFLPGFSTNEKITNFSGRGVGMDVVSTNLEFVGGSVSVESIPGEGSQFTMKIPLTLAIIEGMTIKMGGAKYTIPIISIKKSFIATEKDIFRDPSGNEMIKERGEVYNVVRLYEFFGVESEHTKVEEGVMIMLENGEQSVCLFVDELIGEQQVVVKSIPKYIKKIRGISGCTLLGNGDISLIIDVGGFFDK
ncbi:MAG: chemotaxis protein CheA [Clostridiales bacterium]|nr:chemotaxis protein CheA [Clostridiales bacterium]